jgi:hypothetical protein
LPRKRRTFIASHVDVDRGRAKAVWNSSKDASSGRCVSTSKPSFFIVTFLACASGFGSLYLLLAASLALLLGMSSESSSSPARALVAWVRRSHGGDNKIGVESGFLNAVMKSSVNVAAVATVTLPVKVGVPGLQPTAPSWWPGKST